MIKKDWKSLKKIQQVILSKMKQMKLQMLKTRQKL